MFLLLPLPINFRAYIFRATIILPNDILMVEPLDENLSNHVIYRLKDHKESSSLKTCGNSNDGHDVQALVEKFNMHSGQSTVMFHKNW